MDRSELEGIWLTRAREAQDAMTFDTYVACEQRHISYLDCAIRLRQAKESDDELIRRWRQNVEQAKHALSLRGDLENPFDKSRWEAMVEVNTQCADELEAILSAGCVVANDDESVAGDTILVPPGIYREKLGS